MENTSVMQEIETLLTGGNSSREVIGMGYAPGTVYRVQRQVRRQASSRGDDEAQPEQSPEPLSTDGATGTSLAERVEGLEHRIETVAITKDDVENLLAERLGEIAKRVDGTTEGLNGLKGHFRQLQEGCNQWKQVHDGLVGVVNQSSEAMKKGFAIQGERAKATDICLRELEGQVSRLGERLQATAAASNQLSAKLESMGQRLSRFDAEIQTVRNLALRQPTGEVVTVQLTGNRERRFKQYKSPDGLTRPHLHSRDFFLGNRWVDLAEPEN